MGKGAERVMQSAEEIAQTIKRQIENAGGAPPGSADMAMQIARLIGTSFISLATMAENLERISDAQDAIARHLQDLVAIQRRRT